jgi:acetylornithine deacetylase/succinyl-diaminopimelate desuccinylase-like protein
LGGHCFDGREIHRSPSRVLVGPHTRRTEDLIWTGDLKVFTIRFSPVGFRSIFVIPAEAIRENRFRARLAEAKDHRLPFVAEDFLLALTADEEGGGPYNGVDWLLKNHKDLIDAEFALNEGGRGELLDGKRISNDIQAAEKWYVDLRLEVTNKGGHSSQPVPDNAIYHLAGALVRLDQFGFPMKTNEVTKAYFAEMARIEKGSLQNDLAKVAEGSAEAMERVAKLSPQWNSMLRTTCVATELEGGHAKNALPQLAAANVNCRVMPDDSLEYVESTLKRVIADDQVIIKVDNREANAPGSPLRPDVLHAMNRVTDTMWPGVTVLPFMSTGATDGRSLREAGIPTYGVQGFFNDRNDNRAHGRDERMMVKSFYEGQTFLYELVKNLASQ